MIVKTVEAKEWYRRYISGNTSGCAHVAYDEKNKRWLSMDINGHAMTFKTESEAYAWAKALY